MRGADIDLREAHDAITATTPLIDALTNPVTVNDVANVTLHWGGLPVMADNARELDAMIATAQGCLLNMGDVSETGEKALLVAGRAANREGIPVVLDPVGVGATPTRTEVARRLVEELDITVINGNYAEISTLAGAGATVRGVESVGAYDDIATAARECARATGAVVVASGEVDVVADAASAYELRVGDPMLGRIVGTGCMLGATLAVFAASVEDDLESALAGTAAFGLAAERASKGEYGEFHGPASYKIAFLDAVADFEGRTAESVRSRIEAVE